MNEKLELLREKMIEAKMDAYYFNTSDYHLSEYVPEYFKTIRYFSGFTGSLASLIVDLKKAYIFVDGRYHGQADKECLENDVEVIKLGTAKGIDPIDFMAKNYKGKIIGLDGKRTSIAFAKAMSKKGLKINSKDIYSDIIYDRKPLGRDLIFELTINYTGVSRKQKLDRVLKILNGRCHIVNNLESIAYILNLRSNDILDTPVFMSYLVFLHNQIFLFVDTKRLKDELIVRLNNDGVSVRPYKQYYELLFEINSQIVVLDENKVNFDSYVALHNNKNRFINMRSMIEDMKSIKNDAEIENSRLAHIYDGLCMVKFLYWLDKQDKQYLTEYDCAEYLNWLRLNYKAFELSFSPIVAYNENAAMMHYSPTKGNCARLQNKGILLIDSGGQYWEGTTDITRTIALGEVDEEVKKHFTIVLKSMFNLSSVKFLKGMSGYQLDVLARKDIWELGIDYRCGTGHGVGHVLSVHENPPNVRYMKTENGSEQVPIKVGNIFSDEPGIYLEGKYGIRCENLLLCKESEKNEYGTFLEFETLTLCPFDLNLIDKNYLDEKTIKLLNDYHQNVYDKLSPYLSDEENEFLMKVTRKI